MQAMMTSLIFLLIAAVIGSVVLVGRRATAWPIAALVASALLLTQALHWTRFSLPGVSLALVLSVALAVAGVVLLLRARAKWHVCAATVVALVGSLQALSALNILH
jgi:hypothetical protein